MSKIVILKVKEDFNEEQLAALASEEEPTLTVTGTLEAVYFKAEDYYDVMEAARMFDAQMQGDEDVQRS